MKIRVRKEELVKALGKVSCALGDKNEDIATKNIGIEASDNVLRFVASSQKVCAEYKFNVGDDLDIEQKGKIVVDGLSLISNVTNLHPGVMITAEVQDDGDDTDYKKNLKLTYSTKYDETWEHVHNLIDPTYFPEIDFSWDTKHTVTYPTNQLISGISRAVSAASDEEHRPSYNAVMIGFGPSGVEFFASDGRQMAYSKDSSHSSSEKKQALIQSQVISKIAKKNILDSSENVEISISEGSSENIGKVRFCQSGFTIVTNFAKGADLLPYENVLKIKADLCSFELNAGLLKDDLKVFSDLENKDSKWTFSSDKIKVVSIGNFDRKSEGSISGVKQYDGGAGEVRLSLRYWDSILSKCDNNTDLKVSIMNERVPVSIEVSPEPLLYRFFIMPINDTND